MEDDWDTIADWYLDRLRAGSALHKFAKDILLAALPSDLSGSRVVDVGCGEGLVTRAVAIRGASVVGVDPTERLLEHARAAEDAAPLGARYAVDDAERLATVDTDSTDWVTAGLSLNNVPDLDAALTAVHRVLMAGGGFVFTVLIRVSRPRMPAGPTSGRGHAGEWSAITSSRVSGAPPTLLGFVGRVISIAPFPVTSWR